MRFLMRSKITMFIALAMLLMVALPSCDGSLSSTPSNKMQAASAGSNGIFNEVPNKPTEKKLVWDYANVLDDAQEKALEDSLESFSRNTSNQILVMTVISIGDNDIAEFATQLGQKWGVGHKGDDNGVVVLIRVKSEEENGGAFIATGQGIEGAMPDVLCSRIVEKEMIPHFKEDDYAGGIWAALDVIMPAMKGEFDKDEYMNDTGDLILGLIVMIVIICFIVVAIKNGGMGTGTGTNTRTYTGGPIIFPGSFGSGSSRSSGSSWGGGSSSGGWGGFGGGSFGGGGAGGSW